MENIIGIHLNISKDISSIIDYAKKKIHLEYTSNYNYEPHITLYLAKFPKNKFNTLIKTIALIKIEPFVIELGKFKTNHNNKNKQIFFYINLKKSKELYKLHKKILQTANHLRGNALRIKDQERIKLGKYSKLETQYIKKYGYLRVLRFYKPHITLGATPAASKKIMPIKKYLNKKLEIINGKTCNVNVITVGLYTLDTKHGRYLKTISKKIYL